MLKTGTIESANWKRSHRNTPYLHLVIVLDEPYYLKLKDKKITEVGKVFKSISPLVSLIPGVLTPMQQLEKATGVKIELGQPPKIEEDEPIPELVGKRLTVDIQEAEVLRQVRLYIREILPVGN